MTQCPILTGEPCGRCPECMKAASTMDVFDASMDASTTKQPSPKREDETQTAYVIRLVREDGAAAERIRRPRRVRPTDRRR